MKLTSRNGKLWITFYHHSNRHRRSLGLDDNKANRKLATNKIIPEIQYKLNSGTFFEKEIIPTLDEFTPTSLEIHKHERRELTQKNYERVYRLHITPYFGMTRLDKIKSSDVAKWQNKLLETRTGKTVKAIRSVFQTILEDAMIDELIKTNPFVRVKSPKMSETHEKRPFSKEEMFSIISAMPDAMQCFFAIGFFTGMRTGEIIGLQWADIDWDEDIIKVRRSRRQGVETLPKTKNSIRDVEIIDVLLPYLVRHRELVDESNVYIFETYTGNPYNTCDKISSHYWKPTLKSLDVPYRNLYQMRHSFASLMISNNEDILWVSNMLGHKDSSMTLEKYARYIKQSDKKRATFLSQ